MVRAKNPVRGGAWRSVGALRVRTTRYAQNSCDPRHAHDDLGISLVVAGCLEEISDQGLHRAQCGSLVVKPAGCWHADHYGPRGAVLVQIMLAPHDVESLGWRYGWSEALELTGPLLALAHGAERAAEAAESRLWELLSPLAVLPEFPHHTTAPRWWNDALEQMACAAERPVSVGQLARQFDVHPVYLARVCRRRLGRSVQRFLLERRVLAAWRLLSIDAAPLAAIALQTGFADQAHMSRAFRSVLGTAPGALRRQAAHGPGLVA